MIFLAPLCPLFCPRLSIATALFSPRTPSPSRRARVWRGKKEKRAWEVDARARRKNAEREREIRRREESSSKVDGELLLFFFFLSLTSSLSLFSFFQKKTPTLFNRRRQEAPPLPPRNGRAPRDPQVPEVDRPPDPQAALPAPGPRDRPGLQDRPALPVVGRPGPPGGRRGLPRRSLRGHQPGRHPRQARHHHAQGHPAGPPHPWRARLDSKLFESL